MTLRCTGQQLVQRQVTRQENDLSEGRQDLTNLRSQIARTNKDVEVNYITPFATAYVGDFESVSRCKVRTQFCSQQI